METTESARKVLRSHGYFVDNLWNIEDVQSRYECDKDKAQYVLERALTNEATLEQIFIAIDIIAEIENLKPINNQN